MKKYSALIGNKNGVTHGLSGTKTYYSWVAMINRCYNPKNDRYHNYGGRGIKVCDRWRESFENFLNDMGIRPEDRTLDRIDVNGNYEPSNCRWSDSITQYRNMTKSHYITFRGQTKILSDWAREFGTTTTAIHYHLNTHNDLEVMYQWRLKHNKKVPIIHI